MGLPVHAGSGKGSEVKGQVQQTSKWKVILVLVLIVLAFYVSSFFMMGG